MRCGYLREKGGCGETKWREQVEYCLKRKYPRRGEGAEVQLGGQDGRQRDWVTMPVRDTGRVRRKKAVGRWLFCGL